MIKITIKLCFAILLALTLVSLVAGQEKSETYSEPAAGFSFVIPQGWTMQDIPDKKYKQIFGEKANDFTPNIHILDEDFNGPLEVYAEKGQKYAESSYKQMGFDKITKISQTAFTTKSGQSGIKLTNEIEAYGRKHLFRQYLFAGKNNKVFVFTCSSLADDTITGPACDASMKTLTFTK